MNLDRVFIRNNKDGSRNLLYLSSNKRNYVDMNTKEKYEISEIDQSELYCIYDVLEIDYYEGAKCSKKEIKKAFEKDNDKAIEIKNIFIGDLSQITNILDKQRIGLDYVLTYYNVRLLKKNLLVERFYFGGGYTNVLTGEDYEEYFLNEGNIRMLKDSIKPAALTLGITTTKVKKKELLKRYSEWRCNNE